MGSGRVHVDGRLPLVFAGKRKHNVSHVQTVCFCGESVGVKGNSTRNSKRSAGVAPRTDELLSHNGDPGAAMIAEDAYVTYLPRMFAETLSSVTAELEVS